MASSEELRCRLAAFSQRGWCLLKSPSQSIWSFGRGRTEEIEWWRKVERAERESLLVQSLYTLKIEIKPCTPLNETPVMSLQGISMGEKTSVEMLELIRRMDRVRVVPSFLWLGG